MTASQRRDILEIVEERYGRGSTLVTSQIPVQQWFDVVGEPTLADAILDRLVHNAHKIELPGRQPAQVAKEGRAMTTVTAASSPRWAHRPHPRASRRQPYGKACRQARGPRPWTTGTSTPPLDETRSS